MNTSAVDRRHTGRSTQERVDDRTALERLWADTHPHEEAKDPRRATSDEGITPPTRTPTAA